jgi:hypothetical protein
VFVGWPTARAIWGQRFLPGLLDHLAARLAWDGQMYDGAPPANTPNDLYEPVPGHQGAHGAFDSRAQTSSWEMQVTTRASYLASTVYGLLAPLAHAAGRARARQLTPPPQAAPEPSLSTR